MTRHWWLVVWCGLAVLGCGEHDELFPALPSPPVMVPPAIPGPPPAPPGGGSRKRLFELRTQDAP